MIFEIIKDVLAIIGGFCVIGTAGFTYILIRYEKNEEKKDDNI